MRSAAIFAEFRRAYADALSPNFDDAAWEQAAQIRQIMWMAHERLPLEDSVTCYRQLRRFSNAFRPKMLAAFQREFNGMPITVTPAREYSVTVYFHVADRLFLRAGVDAYIRTLFHADSVTWTDEETFRIWWN